MLIAKIKGLTWVCQYAKLLIILAIVVLLLDKKIPELAKGRKNRL
jgi:hypothetical protein